MRPVLPAVLSLALLSGLTTIAGMALAADESAATADAVMGSVALPASKGGTLSPLAERDLAFADTVRFRSKGTVTAMFIKMKRDMKIEMSPVRVSEQLTAMDTTVTDVAGGGKQWKATLPMSARGTLKSTEPKLINATNILGIDPVIRERLKGGGKPITINGHVEIEGALKPVSITHRYIGRGKEAGTHVIESVTENEDAGIAFKTLSTMAPDGLPLHAETSGTVKKGPIDVAVAIQLTREAAADVEETDAE